MKIMIVEDTLEINKILTTLFSDAGYEVLSFDNALDAKKAFAENIVSCVLTDLMMPIYSGEQFIKDIRPDYYGLIIAITAKTTMEDKLKVLEFGADDYIFKPFNKKEVLLKVQNYTNRINKSNHKTSLNEGEFIFNHHDNKLLINKNEVQLTSVEFLVVTSMIKKLNSIITREGLLDLVYFNEMDVFERAIDGHIKNIRKKIKKHTDTTFIQTVYGLGYKLVGVADE